jgi:hypothetical protein
VIYYEIPSYANSFKLGLPPPPQSFKSYGSGAELYGLVGQLASSTMEEMVSLQNDQVLESKVRSLVGQLADSKMEDVTSWQSDQSIEGREHVEQRAASTIY